MCVGVSGWVDSGIKVINLNFYNKEMVSILVKIQMWKLEERAERTESVGLWGIGVWGYVGVQKYAYKFFNTPFFKCGLSLVTHLMHRIKQSDGI